MFGKTSFNRTRFNRGSTSLGLYVTVRSEFGVAVTPLKALVQLQGATIAAQLLTVQPKLSFKVPLSAVSIVSEFGVQAKPSIKVRLPAVTCSTQIDVQAGSLRTDQSEEFSLQGINLKPGQVLIIDTDQLDIQIDGESIIDAWVSGGTFFQLMNGGNIIQIYDNVSSRALHVTVQWADRYL